MTDNSEFEYDVVVIGGGIQGAGCAQAFAAEGYRTLLLEQSTWASATSSRSSKLIHGGLRYLETFQFSLVRKALVERRRMLKIAPELMTPRKFYIPVYENSKFRPLKVRAGLCLYSALGGFDSLSRFRAVPKRDWDTLGGIKREGLKAVFQYWDTQTDDKLLTEAVVKSAAELGADVKEHAQFLKAQPRGDGYAITYQMESARIESSCRFLVNAAGPWVFQAQETIEGAPPPSKVDLVQGAHIELEGQLGEGIFYAESPRDNRPVFIMPWYDRTLVGTTETEFQGDPSKAAATDEEIDYLLEVVANYFPDFPRKLVNSFAGLRVLPKADGNFNTRPRDTLIEYDRNAKPRWVSLYGGKLTAYRATAESIVDKVSPIIGQRPSQHKTRTICLPRL